MRDPTIPVAPPGLAAFRLPYPGARALATSYRPYGTDVVPQPTPFRHHHRFLSAAARRGIQPSLEQGRAAAEAMIHRTDVTMAFRRVAFWGNIGYHSGLWENACSSATATSRASGSRAQSAEAESVGAGNGRRRLGTSRPPDAPLAAGADVRENWRGLGQVAGNKMDPVVAYGEASGRRKPAGFPHARHLREEFAISPSVKSADGRKSGRRDNAPMG